MNIIFQCDKDRFYSFSSAAGSYMCSSDFSNFPSASQHPSLVQYSLKIISPSPCAQNLPPAHFKSQDTFSIFNFENPSPPTNHLPHVIPLDSNDMDHTPSSIEQQASPHDSDINPLPTQSSSLPLVSSHSSTFHPSHIITRSQTNCFKPKSFLDFQAFHSSHYPLCALHISSDIIVPKSFSHAIKSPEWK